MDISKLADEIIEGKRIDRNFDCSFFIDYDLEKLCDASDRIREKLCGGHVDLCTIINGKSGRCSENCKFCAQSAHNCTGVEEYGFIDENIIINEAIENAKKGVHRFSVVTAGRSLNGKDFDMALGAYYELNEKADIELCASHGLLTDRQFEKLYEAGVRRYHCNIETSKRNFPNICTSHTYDEKIENIKRAQRAGLEVCSGGIIGMGETWNDRIDMAISLSELNVVSIPINALTPIKGTPLESVPKLTESDILRTVAIFRFINPEIYIRLAAGRALMKDSGKKAFLSGTNAAITGDMLTTSGSSIKGDIDMLLSMSFDVGKKLASGN